MIGNFRLAHKFGTILSKRIYENVFFDRFNSVYKGFYLVVGEQQLNEMIQNNWPIKFLKIPSTERFGSQDVIALEFYDPNTITPDQRKLIYMLNSSIQNGSYQTVEE